MSGTLSTYGAIIGALVLVYLYRLNAGMRLEYRQLTGAVPDEVSGVFNAAAIPVTLLPEMEWASLLDRPIGLAVFSVHGAEPSRAVGAASSLMRGYENAFMISDHVMVAALWDTDPLALARAAARLGTVMATTNPVLDVGVAIYPHDGAEVEELVALAQLRSRPIQDIAAAVDRFPFQRDTTQS